MLELFKINHFDVPAGTISESGIYEIRRFIVSQSLQGTEWKAANPDNTATLLPLLPDDWQWKWLVGGRGEYVGTFPKRVAKFYFKTYHLRCPDSFLTQIGNLAKAHSESAEAYHFDFVNRIEWQAGDFGDSHSCYWGSYAGAKVMITDNGGMAIRFYDGNDKGIGRAWLIPIDDDLYIIFNGYGLGGDSTLRIARIFALFIGLQYKRITLSNSDGGLYINNSVGYIIGRMEAIDGIERHDFNWYEVELDTCHHCGRQLDEDDYYRGADDEHYCENCFYQFFSDCSQCGEPHYREDLTYVESTGYDVCEWCLGRYYFECYRCEENYPKQEAQQFGKQVYCLDCAQELKIEGDNIE
jgi:hypothetical protein